MKNHIARNKKKKLVKEYIAKNNISMGEFNKSLRSMREKTSINSKCNLATESEG